MAIRIKKMKYENTPYVLPANNKELQSFVDKYKVDMTEQVVSSIEFAMKHKLPLIEVFQFKDSKFVVTVTPTEFDINLEAIYKFYLETEQYELCKRVAKLRNQLKEQWNEKKKKTSTGSK